MAQLHTDVFVPWGYHEVVAEDLDDLCPLCGHPEDLCQDRHSQEEWQEWLEGLDEAV